MLSTRTNYDSQVNSLDSHLGPHCLLQRLKLPSVLPPKSDSGVMFCLQSYHVDLSSKDH